MAALMLFNHSRRAARVDPGGELITLEEQDRGLWDEAMIREGHRLLHRSLGAGEVGPYALQAAIVACHAEAREVALTDWPRIAGLYELLLSTVDTPVVRLNRAVAVALAGNLEAGLDLLVALEEGGELRGYHLLAAARADLLRRAGRPDEAAGWYQQAITEAPDGPERRFLTRQLGRLEDGA